MANLVDVARLRTTRAKFLKPIQQAIDLKAPFSLPVLQEEGLQESHAVAGDDWTT
jgi:hypothetical protein